MVCTCKKTSPLFFPPSPSSPVSSLHPGRGRQPLFHPRPTVRRKPHHHHPIAFFLSCLQYALLRVAVSFFVHMGQCHRHHLLWSDRLMQPTRAQPLPAIWSSPAEGAGADKLFQSHLHHIQVGIHSPCRLTRLVIPLRKQNGPIPSLVMSIKFHLCTKSNSYPHAAAASARQRHPVPLDGTWSRLVP
ncbi:hypothetical protein HDK64DRAFT_80703 [Phyllosticta capitalensis]